MSIDSTIQVDKCLNPNNATLRFKVTGNITKTVLHCKQFVSASEVRVMVSDSREGESEATGEVRMRLMEGE